ncbi:rod-binding protein [Vibrio sp. WXL103]|uniref:rod-binding protein n=1 Tax=Vibrio sp. WXL103 TaxID=3450710 RepID=UPI003EC93A67
MSITVMPINPMTIQAMPGRSSAISSNSAMSGVNAFDSRNLNQLKLADEQQALEGVAEQFESMFLQMVLKQMRQANEALNDNENNPLFNSRELKTYQEFFDGQLSMEMAKGSIGLAESIVAQLSRGDSEQVANLTPDPFKEVDDSVALYSQQQPTVAPSHSSRAFQQPLLLVNDKETEL